MFAFFLWIFLLHMYRRMLKAVGLGHSGLESDGYSLYLQSIFFLFVHIERCPGIECQCFFFLIYIDKQP